MKSSLIIQVLTYCRKMGSDKFLGEILKKINYKFARSFLLLKNIIKSIFLLMITPFISRLAIQDSKKRRVTILSPLIWVIAFILSTSSFYFLWGGELWLKIFFALLDLILIAYFIYKYEFFSKNDPDRLHTEEFLIALKEIEQKAVQGEKPTPIDNLELVNPQKLIDKK